MREKPQSGSVLRVALFASMVMFLFLCSSVCLGARVACDDGSRGGGKGIVGQGDIQYGDPDMPQGKGTGSGNPLTGSPSRESKTSLRNISFQGKGNTYGGNQLIPAGLDARLAFRFCLIYLVQR